MSDIDDLAAMFYAAGTDPIDYAVGVVADFLAVLIDITTARRADPGAYAGYGRDASPEHMGRRVIAGLLNAGWTPPSDEERTAAIRRARAETAWLEKNKHLPCSRCGHGLFAHTGIAWPSCCDCGKWHRDDKPKPEARAASHPTLDRATGTP